MKSLAVRVTLLLLFVATASVTAYLVWKGDTLVRAETDAARAFDDRALAAARGMLDLRAAQQAYVAAGQGDQFWTARVSTALTDLANAIEALRTEATTVQAQSAFEAAAAVLEDFAQMDRRARDFARSGQKLLASDVIFSDGFEMTRSALVSVDEGRVTELKARNQAISDIRRQQIVSLGVAGGLAFLVIALLVPRSEEHASEAKGTTRRAERASWQGADLSLGLNDTTGRPARRVEESFERAQVPFSDPQRGSFENPRMRLSDSSDVTPAESGPGASVASAQRATFDGAQTEPFDGAKDRPTSKMPEPVDLVLIASLCADLARIVDTRSLPSILGRASSILGASGIVLWIADPDGRELMPIAAHGYPPHLVTRIGNLKRDAENATAAAFRTGLVQTVKADAVSNGAIAAPLVSPLGVVGVMAAEVRNNGETQPERLAATSILAAQLATLVGPPVPRSQSKTEAAGA